MFNTNDKNNDKPHHEIGLVDVALFAIKSLLAITILFLLLLPCFLLLTTVYACC